MAKNFRSRLGIRSRHGCEAFFQRDAEVLFLEHAAELLGDGGGHLRGDQVEPEGQALAGAEGAGEHLQASGSWAAKAFSRVCGGERAPTSSGSDPKSRASTGIKAGWMRTTRLIAGSATASDRGDRDQLADGQARCRPARTAGRCCRNAPGTSGRSRCLSSSGRPSRLLFLQAVLPRGLSRHGAGQHVEAVFDAVGPACRGPAWPLRPPGRRRPRTPDCPTSSGTARLNPPTSRVRGRRWTASARRPIPAAT